MPRPTRAEVDAADQALSTLIDKAGTGAEEAALRTLRRAAAELPELLGQSDTAAEFGVATGNLSRLTTLPEPLYTLKVGKFYDKDEVCAAAAARKAKKAESQAKAAERRAQRT